MFFLGVGFAFFIDFVLTEFVSDGASRSSSVSPGSYMPTETLQVDSIIGNDEPDAVSRSFNPT